MDEDLTGGMMTESHRKHADDLFLRSLSTGSPLLMDGGMGTMLQAKGLTSHGEVPDLLNLTDPDAITEVHRAYVEAGAQLITTNTFGANRLKLDGHATVDEVYAAAVENARNAGAPMIAGDIGPTGALLEPIGELSFEEAVGIFAEQVRALDSAGCDVVIIETQTDLLEAKAAAIAVKENSDLPFMVSMSFGEDGRTFLGTPPEVAAIVFSSLGAAAVGMNCSLGPDALLPLAERMVRYLRCPLLIKPNAGLPKVVDGETAYELGPMEYAVSMRSFIELGATVIGGCCGTTPEHISAIADIVRDHPTSRVESGNTGSDRFIVASSTDFVDIDPGTYGIAVIGENINPTRRKRLKEALQRGELDAVVGEALAEKDAGADILDVNVGVPGIDEPKVMADVVDALQGMVSTPLQIDSSDPSAIELAVRRYAGKPIINSVNGDRDTLDAILPIAKKYGCCVLGLTLDGNGIPPTAEERIEIASRIIGSAVSLDIPKSDVAIDCLVMTAATHQPQIAEIFRALTMVKRDLGVATVLGVSNVSFGLPDRRLLNATFMSAAVGAGLDMPIIDPCNDEYMDAMMALRVLNGQDEGSAAYIASSDGRYARRMASSSTRDTCEPAPDTGTGPSSGRDSLIASLDLSFVDEDALPDIASMVEYLLSGRPAPMAGLVRGMLSTMDGLALIENILMPTLDEVGSRYESGKTYLPQLISSAEAAKAAFDVIKETGSADTMPQEGRKPIVLATVKGDIHDIGKNIVAMLLENHGFEVIDLGFDVAPRDVLGAVAETGAKLVGLSALMTTTVDSMAETIELLHSEMPDVEVMVGGAVLTQEFADEIGADHYSKDAAGAVRIAKAFFEG